jgi:hypothetical protein
MALTSEHLGDFLINELRTDTDPGRRKAEFAALKILGITKTDALARIDALEKADALARAAPQVAHCFIDASNAGTTPQNILKILEEAMLPSHVADVIVVGSAKCPIACQHIVKNFLEMGCKAYFLPRGLGKETTVDSVLITFIQQLLLTYDPIDQLLVLGTADGNDNDGLPSFFATVLCAIRRGWHVRLVCRNPNRKYEELAKQHPNQLEIVLLRATSSKSCSSTPPLSRNGSSTSLRCVTDVDSSSSQTSPQSLSSQSSQSSRSSLSSQSSLSSLSSPSPSPPPPLLLPPPIGDQAQDDEKDWKCLCGRENFPWNTKCRGCNRKK